MSVARRQSVTLPSVLDRLLDDNPEQPQQGSALYFELVDFKAALARDLEALLNTRVVEFEELFEQHPLAADSVINFGIPDLSGLSLLNPDDREQLRERVRRAIERHEPRLTRVRISLDVPDDGQRLLRFRVDAVLKVHPHRPPVTFDATLQLSSNSYQVRGQR
ncbi:MAG TPA: type VI secretion system baseplate subunit TssE [Chitinolyticbacter sp.]|uniref:type VI secretion system baseplate subunit TssE n=1 Tax=Chitinolyticbacter albus TaxID=2961951 RepID=UPI00210CF3A6|nr:type VI secretion system baseplate subunit TssE [Chitinolyticbacter albus]HSC80421.1 type VI secretion system baseplate subunit TssE [Chitinolyticbacter sp.]